MKSLYININVNDYELIVHIISNQYGFIPEIISVNGDTTTIKIPLQSDKKNTLKFYLKPKQV